MRRVTDTEFEAFNYALEENQRMKSAYDELEQKNINLIEGLEAILDADRLSHAQAVAKTHIRAYKSDNVQHTTKQNDHTTLQNEDQYHGISE